MLNQYKLDEYGDVLSPITEARKARMAAQLNSIFDLGGTNERPEED